MSHESLPATDTDLTDKVVVITGASSGIGAAVAMQAAAQGARVVLGARRLDRLELLADKLGGSEHAIAVPLDVTDWESCQAFAAAATDAFGGIDAFVANAGFGAERGWLNSSPEHWREMVLTNVYGAAISVRAALPALIERRGTIVVTSSVAGRRVLPGSLYSVTKHAATAMAEALRQELVPSGVRVTSIEPGMTDTPFFDDGTPDWALDEDDVARSVCFALTQPAHVNLSTLTIRPTAQPV
jgi:NADP-dependent 3-hydroxy acid dehydrogenase YdfG